MYWESILDPDGQLNPNDSSHQKLIEQLQGGLLKAANFTKKNHRYPLYSAKLNDADRVVFANYTDLATNTSHLIVLGVFDKTGNSHARYQLFLKNEAYAKHQQLLARINAQTQQFKLTVNNDIGDPTQYPTAIESYDYYGQQAIALSDDQESVLTLEPPTLIEGPPGSGKSVTALQLLIQLVQQRISKQPIVYIAPYRLAVVMREKWGEMAITSQIDPDLVRFIDPDLLVQYCLKTKDQASNITIVGRHRFEEWLKSIFKTSLKAVKWEKQPNKVEIYNEFKIIAAIGSNQYHQLGVRASRIVVNDRIHLVSLFNRYRSYLDETDCFDVSICELRFDIELLDAVVVDESQSIPPCLLRQLTQRHNPRTFCFMGTNQVSDDILTAKRYLNKIKQRRQFTGSYRVPAAVALHIQRLLTLKYMVAGGQADIGQSYEFSSNISTDGNVAWIDNEQDKYIESLKSRSQDSSTRFQTAIVCFDETERQNVRDALETNMVFLPLEIQGLEFPYIIIWNPIKEIRHIPIDKLKKVTQIDDEKAHKAHGSKEIITNHEAALLAINRLFIAMSRSLSQVDFFIPDFLKSEQQLLSSFQLALGLSLMPYRQIATAASSPLYIPRAISSKTKF